MKNNNDWRLTNQERFLKGVALKKSSWKLKNPAWTHDHCAFCHEKFSEAEGGIHIGYCTQDEYHWICPECFDDFKEMFQWEEWSLKND